LFQTDQKLGKKEFDGGQARQHYAKRKTLVVASLYVALLENNINIKKPLLQLNRAIEGKDASELSVKRCLKELGLPSSHLSSLQQKRVF